MDNTIFRIGEMADFFQLPAATLRYWEEMGVLLPGKSSQNQYREYTLPDLMKISDIIFYKGLGISLKQIGKMEATDIPAQQQLCDNQLKELLHQEELLKYRRKKLTEHRRALETAAALSAKSFYEEEIDTSCIVRFELTEIDKLRTYIDCPYLYSRVQDSTDLMEEARGISVPPDYAYAPGELLWTKEKGSHYMVCLLKEEKKPGYPNNMGELLSQVQKTYRTGKIISRFLVSGEENGVKYDFYKTFIELV